MTTSRRSGLGYSICLRNCRSPGARWQARAAGAERLLPISCSRYFPEATILRSWPLAVPHLGATEIRFIDRRHPGQRKRAPKA
jgi:hypothetical protein